MIEIMAEDVYLDYLVLGTIYLAGTNKLNPNIMYMAVPWYWYPIVRLELWLTGSKCRRCNIDVLEEMGMII